METAPAPEARLAKFVMKYVSHELDEKWESLHERDRPIVQSVEGDTQSAFEMFIAACMFPGRPIEYAIEDSPEGVREFWSAHISSVPRLYKLETPLGNDLEFSVVSRAREVFDFLLENKGLLHPALQEEELMKKFSARFSIPLDVVSPKT